MVFCILQGFYCGIWQLFVKWYANNISVQKATLVNIFVMHSQLCQILVRSDQYIPICMASSF